MTSTSSLPVSPDTVTTRQLVGEFKPKHWVSVISTLFAVIAALVYGGFWVGQHLTEAKTEAQIAKLTVEMTKLESTAGELRAELKVASARKAQLAETNAAWQSTHQKTLGEMARQQQEVVSLSTALGRASNCTFIHEQIRSIDMQMKSTGSLVVFSAGEEWKKEQSERKTALQSQLAAYQQQLGQCNS